MCYDIFLLFCRTYLTTFQNISIDIFGILRLNFTSISLQFQTITSNLNMSDLEFCNVTPIFYFYFYIYINIVILLFVCTVFGKMASMMICSRLCNFFIISAFCNNLNLCYRVKYLPACEAFSKTAFLKSDLKMRLYSLCSTSYCINITIEL